MADPVLNAYRISANSQMARFQAGRASLDELPFWSLQHDWGRAGHDALVQLEGLTGRADQAEILTRIAAARTQPSQYQFNQAIEIRQAPGSAQTLARLMPVRPKGVPLPDDVFATLQPFQVTRWLEACNRTLPDGRPGCVLIRGVFSLDADGRTQAMVLYLDDRGRGRANHLWLREGGDIEVNEVFDPAADRWAVLPADAVAQALDGAFGIRPSGINALHIGDAILVPAN